MKTLEKPVLEAIKLTTQLTTSGEAEIWHTNRKGVIAKIYHIPNKDKEEKLRAMSLHPLRNKSGRGEVIWPTELMRKNEQTFCGYLMPKVKGSRTLQQFINPVLRKNNQIETTPEIRKELALGLALRIAEVHAEGHVVGDLKPQNVLFNRAREVFLIDTDSFQICSQRPPKVFYCPVGSSNYTPPELMGQNFKNAMQKPEQDHFRLGLLIYQILLDAHPFQGIWPAGETSMNIDACIAKGYWAHRANGPIKPNKLQTGFRRLPQMLQELFKKCFESTPTERPSALEWSRSLAQLLKLKIQLPMPRKNTKPVKAAKPLEKKQISQGLNLTKPLLSISIKAHESPKDSKSGKDNKNSSVTMEEFLSLLEQLDSFLDEDLSNKPAKETAAKTPIQVTQAPTPILTSSVKPPVTASKPIAPSQTSPVKPPATTPKSNVPTWISPVKSTKINRFFQIYDRDLPVIPFLNIGIVMLIYGFFAYMQWLPFSFEKMLGIPLGLTLLRVMLIHYKHGF